MVMEIRPYRPSDRKEWDDYVKRHPDGTVFHLSGWKGAVERSFGPNTNYLLAVDSASFGEPATRPDGEEIVGIFPLFYTKNVLFGRYMVSVPFATYGGILADGDDIQQALYEQGVAITKGMALEYLELRNERSQLKGLPTKDLYYVFKKEISSDNDKNLLAIPRKARRMVRKGIKEKLDARFGNVELLDEFYELFAFSYRSLGTPVFPKIFLRKLLRQYGSDSSILIIYKDVQPLSGVLSFYFKDQVIPYYSGSYPESRNFAANDYMYWALMSDAADKGYRIFDFGRSKKDTGSYHFKRHWGFEPLPLPYQYYLNKIEEIPNISPTNPKYQRLIELWKKLPLWATKIIGPRIVKYIP